MAASCTFSLRPDFYIVLTILTIFNGEKGIQCDLVEIDERMGRFSEIIHFRAITFFVTKVKQIFFFFFVFYVNFHQ